MKADVEEDLELSPESWEDLEEEDDGGRDESVGRDTGADRNGLRLRRAIERIEERKALRAAIADGFGDPSEEG